LAVFEKLFGEDVLNERYITITTLVWIMMRYKPTKKLKHSYTILFYTYFQLFHIITNIIHIKQYIPHNV